MRLSVKIKMCRKGNIAKLYGNRKVYGQKIGSKTAASNVARARQLIYLIDTAVPCYPACVFTAENHGVRGQHRHCIGRDSEPHKRRPDIPTQEEVRLILNLLVTLLCVLIIFGIIILISLALKCTYIFFKLLKPYTWK